MIRRIVSALLIVMFVSTAAWALLEICRCGMENVMPKASSQQCCNGPEKISDKTCDGRVAVQVEKYTKPALPVSDTTLVFLNTGSTLLLHDLTAQIELSNLSISHLEKLSSQTITPLRL